MKLWLTVAAFTSLAASIGDLAKAQEYSPHARENFPMQLLWGDTHVHSSFSMDASSAGNLQLEPADAYRFARGEAVVANSGMTARLEQPLDFLVVSDHAEYMGLLPKLRAADPALLADPAGRRLHESLKSSTDGGLSTVGLLVETLIEGGDPIIDNAPFERSIWEEITRQADAANEPGRFTTLIGWEWSCDSRPAPIFTASSSTATAPTRASRRSSSRGAASTVSMYPEDLMDGGSMETYRDAARRAQSSSRSRTTRTSPTGYMFALRPPYAMEADHRRRVRAALGPALGADRRGDAVSRATRRPTPMLSPDDPFADFETWDFGNIHVLKTVPKRDDMLPFEYARSALKLGLGEAARTGANPFAFGMIGSTDSHTSLAAGAEDDFWGKLSSMEPGPRTWVANNTPVEPGELSVTPWSFAASGYAGVWAHENTREAVFDAMQRKEVFATTGSRIALRFFGGFAFDDDDANRPHLARIGYRKGVPMGGALRGTGERAPGFLVAALKDPYGANLDRIQIIKGWRDPSGRLLEQVYDVALSDGRRSFFGRVRDVGSTVDPETARYTNDIGAAELRAFWRDPDFDPREHAFYYARVLEIPTPRWNVYDAVRLGAAVPPEVPATVRDRAYSSPIWYVP